MFGTHEVIVNCDPEDAESLFVVFTVRCQGENSDLIDKPIEWHERVNAVPVGFVCQSCHQNEGQ
jgi:hypothetical protein